LEDISAPRCFEIERRVQEALDIPVMHDDQHGTAIVALASLINATKVVGKRLEECRVVLNGAGAAGTADQNSSKSGRKSNRGGSYGAIYMGRGDLNQKNSFSRMYKRRA
jgi:malate dehydrogenase (oxaloacetate-decarboxylating)